MNRTENIDPNDGDWDVEPSDDKGWIAPVVLLGFFLAYVTYVLYFDNDRRAVEEVQAIHLGMGHLAGREGSFIVIAPSRKSVQLLPADGETIDGTKTLLIAPGGCVELVPYPDGYRTVKQIGIDGKVKCP